MKPHGNGSFATEGVHGTLMLGLGNTCGDADRGMRGLAL